MFFISPRYNVIALCKLPQPHTRNTLSTSPTTQQTQPRRASSHVIPLVLSSTQHASPGGGLELVVNRSRVLSPSLQVVKQRLEAGPEFLGELHKQTKHNGNSHAQDHVHDDVARAHRVDYAHFRAEHGPSPLQRKTPLRSNQ